MNLDALIKPLARIGQLIEQGNNADAVFKARDELLSLLNPLGGGTAEANTELGKAAELLPEGKAPLLIRLWRETPDLVNVVSWPAEKRNSFELLAIELQMAIAWHKAPQTPQELSQWCQNCAEVLRPIVVLERTAAYQRAGYFANESVRKGRTYANLLGLAEAADAFGECRDTLVDEAFHRLCTAARKTTLTPTPAEFGIMPQAAQELATFLERVSEAWEQGHSIVAEKLNAILVEKAPGERIDATAPAAGITLAVCQQRMRNALAGLRPHLLDIQEANEIVYWITCDDLMPVGRGSMPPDAELEHEINLLKKMDWKPESWRAHVVRAVEQHATTWRQSLDELRQQLAEISRSRVPPGEQMPDHEPAAQFVPLAAHREILRVLDGRALRADGIANETNIQRRTLFDRKRRNKSVIRGYLSELTDRKMVLHHPRLGYYRPDRPPPGLSGVSDAATH